MAVWVALLRGINVGGKHIVPMRILRELVKGLGYRGVQTYIQSGNCIFETDGENVQALAPKLAADIENEIEKAFGFKVPVLLLTDRQLLDALSYNPYDVPESEGAKVHISFLAADVPNDPRSKLEALQANEEEWHLKGRLFYLYAPNGIGRSKLAAKVESILGVPTTARNLRTVRKLQALVKTIE